MSSTVLNSAVAGEMQVADRVSTAGSRAALLYFRVFFFFFACLSFFFAKFGARLATPCLVHETFWSREGGFNWTQNDGDAHPWWKQGKKSYKCIKFVLLATPPSQSHDGTEVRNPPMLDAVITYPPSPGPDTLSSRVPLRSSACLAQLSAADTLYGPAG